MEEQILKLLEEVYKLGFESGKTEQKHEALSLGKSGLNFDIYKKYYTSKIDKILNQPK